MLLHWVSRRGTLTATILYLDYFNMLQCLRECMNDVNVMHWCPSRVAFERAQIFWRAVSLNQHLTWHPSPVVTSPTSGFILDWLSEITKGKSNNESKEDIAWICSFAMRCMAFPCIALYCIATLCLTRYCRCAMHKGVGAVRHWLLLCLPSESHGVDSAQCTKNLPTK